MLARRPFSGTGQVGFRFGQLCYRDNPKGVSFVYSPLSRSDKA